VPTKTITVFKTSVTTRTEVGKLKPLLDTIFEMGEHWNFDLEDRENILRIESAPHKADQVINALSASGYECVELDG
jgi:hypothetical protein